ncbi:5-amino-6-(D-ribitylamino)uracil--L-tyrosine 4-hydroxyphenyl transferase [Streptomyces microflavus]
MTEFVTLPFIHTNAPVYLAGIARPGPTDRDNRAVTAMARLLLHPHITNIQTSWVKLGTEGAAEMLRSGANDLGGTLMEETISRMAGSSYGSYRSIQDLKAIAELAGRPSRRAPRCTGRSRPNASRRPRPRTATCRNCCRCCRAEGEGRGRRAGLGLP